MLKQLIIEITNACNSACVFCPRRFSKRPVTHMGMDMFEDLVEQCAALGFATNALPVGLCGIGEPLVHPDFKEALKIAAKHKLPIGVGSNAGLLEDHIDTLLAYTPAQVVFSIDAVTQTTHAKMRPGVGFEKAVGAIEQYLGELGKAKNQPTDLWVQILVSKHNNHEVTPFIRHWLPKLDKVRGGKVFVKPICPWPYASANTLYPSPAPNIPDDLRNHPRVEIGAFDQPVKFRESCTLFDGFAQVLSDGSYVPCCMPTADPWHIGNVAKARLDKLFNCSYMCKMREESKDRLVFCRDCV